MAVVIRRSDKYPVGTVVKAYAAVGGSNRHHEGKPSGTALAEATVAADGSLTFSTLAEGIYSFWAEVAGTNANMLVGSESFTAPGTLKERIARRRQLVGAQTVGTTATIVRGDLYPVGTAVSVYTLPVPRPGDFLRKLEGSPANTPLKLSKLGEATVSAAGKLELTGLTTGQPYLLAAEVASEWRYLQVRSPAVGDLV